MPSTVLRKSFSLKNKKRGFLYMSELVVHVELEMTKSKLKQKHINSIIFSYRVNSKY